MTPSLLDLQVDAGADKNFHIDKGAVQDIGWIFVTTARNVDIGFVSKAQCSESFQFTASRFNTFEGRVLAWIAAEPLDCTIDFAGANR